MGPHRTSTVPVNVSVLERRFEDGDEVSLEALVERGIVKNTKTDVKVLGQGELTKKLAVTAHAFSASAREKIEKAGGSATALRPPRQEKKRAVKPRTQAEPEPAAEETPEPAETPNQESA